MLGFMFFPVIITLFEWVIIIALIVVIATAVASIIISLSGSSNAGNPAPSPAAATASQNMVALIAALGAERRTPTAAECANLRRWHNEAMSGGISTDVTGPALRAIERLCPDN